MRILLTGATGFIGSNLARALSEHGHRVAFIYRATSDTSFVREHGDGYLYDGSTPSLIEALKASQAELVIHVASCFIAEHQTKDIENIVSSNVLFGTQLLEAMTMSGCHRIINTGTAWQYFHSRSYNPSCLYAASKQAFESMLDFYVNARDFVATTLYIFDTYGPNDPRRKLFRLLLDLNSGRRDKLEMSPGEQKINLLYISDVIEAFMTAAVQMIEQPPAAHRRYVIPGKETLPLRDLVATFSGISGRTLPIEWGKKPYRQREIMEPWGDGEVLPDWSPQVPLQEGISKVIAADREKDLVVQHGASNTP